MRGQPGVQAWRREVVQDVLGLSCWVDRLERQTSSLSNTAAAYAWVWAWSPDDIPLGSGHSFLDRAPDGHGRPALPEGTPREEALHGPQFPVIIHLDTTKDYTPLSDRAPGASQEWPLVERFRWTHFFQDGTVAPAYPGSPAPSPEATGG